MDTPRYRIGNDLTIFWAINNRDGSPYDLDGKEVRLFMTHERGREEVKATITQLTDGVRNNVIRWDFKGEDQRILGKYTLTFVVLESDTHRELTKDYGEAFTLVGRSEMKNEEGDVNISIGGDLILSTKLDIYRIQATNVDVADLKNQVYDVEKGLASKVEQKEFNEKTGEIENAFVKVETSIKGINTEIKDASGEITQIKQSIDGIEVSVGDLEYKVESLEKQTDGAIEKWFYPGPPSAETLPESNWKTEQEKYSHLGDLYYDEDSGIAYRYITKDNLYLWVVIEDADIVAALEAAKNNNRTFIDQPRPPYKVGDLWIAERDYDGTDIEQNDLVVCVVTREEGQFDIADWEKRSPGINDEDLENFVDGYYNEIILPEISKQADKQARAYYGPDDPSLAWEEGTESEHVGDLWYDTNSNKAYYWSGSGWVESDVPEEVFDKIDGKNTIFTSKPEGVAYKENDLWFTEQDYDLEGFQHHKGEILVALEDAVYNEETETYTFSYADWAKRDTYTDDTAVKNLDDYIRTGFKDGVLTESEKQSISSAWDSIVLAQDQLTQDYLTVILPGYTLPEFEELQKAYKAVYNEESTDEYPDLGTFQILEQKVNDVLAYEPTYEPTVDEEAIAALIDAYDEAYDAYRMALSNYTTAYAEFVNAVRAELGQANEYIEAIIDDGKLTPIEKKQLLEIYKSLAAEYDSNVDMAYTAKIWKRDDEGNEVPGVYAGPKGEGQEYFDIYLAYKEAYNPIVAVFTGSDWGFDKMDETTTFGGSVNLSQLDAYFDAYYEALRAIARVISAVAEEKAEASLAMKEYMDDLEEVLTPTEAITQVGKGALLSSIIGVGTYDEQTGEYLVKAGMNATAKETEDLITISKEHGRIVFVGGADGKTDWNQATFVVYEDGYVHFRAGKIDKNVQIGEAVLQAVIADEINLLSWPEYDAETGETKLTPLFQVNTETDASGKKKIVSISSIYDLYINGNLIVAGDTSSEGTGESVVSGITGIKLNGTTYKDENNDGIIDLGTITGGLTSVSWSDVQGRPTRVSEFLNDSGFITSAALLGYATQSWVEGKGYITGIDKPMVASAVGSSGNAGKVLSSTGGDLGWVSLPTSLPASDVYAWAKKSSLALVDVPDLSSKYLSVNGGTIGGELTINPSSGFGSFNVYNADDTYRLTHIWDGNTARLYNIKRDGSSYGILNLQGTIQINGNTAIHSGNIGDYALKVNPTNINLASDTNVAGYGQTSDGWPVAGPALLLSNSVGNYAMMLSGRNGVLRFNTREAGNLTGWKTIAFTDSNVASAQALTHSNGTVGAVVNSSGNMTIGGSDLAGAGVKLHVDGITKIHHPNALQGVQSLLHLTGTLVGSTAKGKGVAITLGMDSNQYYSKIATIFESQNPDYLRPALAFFTMSNTYVAGSEVERMRIASNGNVGIGTDNPAYKLDVNGTGRFTGAVTMSSALSVTSGVTSTGFLTNGNYGIWRGSSYTSAMTANDIVFYADYFRFDCGSSFVKTLEIKESLVTVTGNLVVTGDISA